MSAIKGGRPAGAVHLESDLQKYLQQSSREDGAPPPPPKESHSSTSAPSVHAESHFTLGGLSRTSSTHSIFSFSRASFSSQLSTLTSMTLPQAEYLAASIAAAPTAPKAIKALMAASDQIQTWTRKAIRVLGNLDADDDVEWAAAAGREALDETDRSVRNFETLVTVYVQAIDEVRSRPDIADLETADMSLVLFQTEKTLNDWEKVRKYLKVVHDQVELAMEWEELWSVVLGDVGNEIDNLSRMVFEMEEKRHRAMHADTQDRSTGTLDLNELATMVEETPSRAEASPNYRFSLPPVFASSPLDPQNTDSAHDDSNLLALFARMQPLRASLDFLPMRLSMFQSRAEKIFPSACTELEDKRERLEKGWQQLEREAETLRREMSEDRWILVFRNAGRQAQKMCESVERSVTRLQDALDTGIHLRNPSLLAKKIESFEAKKTHYSPAIDRILAIIKKGLNDRLTVNGEILSLHTDMSTRARLIKERITVIERVLDGMSISPNSQLRDSTSSSISIDRSMSGSFVDTPLSSPASSITPSARKVEHRPPTPGRNVGKQRTSSTTRPPPPSVDKRNSTFFQARRPTTPLSSRTTNPLPQTSVSPATSNQASIYRQGLYSPPTAPIPKPQPTPTNKPRWVSSTNTSGLRAGQNFKSLSSPSSSPYRKGPPNSSRSVSSFSSIPLPSPLSREASYSPATAQSQPAVTQHGNRLASFAERVASPSLDPVVPFHRGRVATSTPPGTIRSPSSVAVHNRSRPTMSSLSQIPPQSPFASLNETSMSPSSPLTRSSSDSPKLPPKSEDSGIGLSTDEDEDDSMNNRDKRDQRSNLSSSGHTKPRSASRPSTATGLHGTTGKRMSLLPLPQGKMRGSGRQSSLGENEPWK